MTRKTYFMPIGGTCVICHKSNTNADNATGAAASIQQHSDAHARTHTHTHKHMYESFALLSS